METQTRGLVGTRILDENHTSLSLVGGNVGLEHALGSVMSSSLNQIPGCRTSPGQSTTRADFLEQRPPLSLSLWPPDQRSGHLLCRLCVLLCAFRWQPPLRRSLHRQAKHPSGALSGSPGGRGPHGGRHLGWQRREYSRQRLGRLRRPLSRPCRPVIAGTWWRPCSAPAAGSAPPLCRCWPTPSFGAEAKRLQFFQVSWESGERPQKVWVLSNKGNYRLAGKTLICVPGSPAP